MRALVVYESIFGNTKRIALAIADGLRGSADVEVVEVGEAPKACEGVDLLVVGGPTHAGAMSRAGRIVGLPVPPRVGHMADLPEAPMRCLVLLPALVACSAGSAIPAFDPEKAPGLETIGTADDALAVPRDLAFDPENPANLWTVNRETDAVVIFFAAGTPAQVSEERADRYGNHFMEEVAGMAFGAPGTFATVQESRNTYDHHSAGNDFMGPALWPSDLEVFAEVNQGPSGLLGSHLDMLHGSPNAMGIAWDHDNVYWVFDGDNAHLVRYDFQQDHGPGYDDHADGIVRRYVDVELERVRDVPSHMELDAATGILYIAHTATGEVLAVDTNSAAFHEDLALINEPLEEHSSYTGAAVEILASGLVEPSGLALDGDVLYVGDHATGEVIAYSTVDGAELGRMQTGHEGVMGLAVDATRRLWFVDGAASEVVRIDRKGR